MISLTEQFEFFYRCGIIFVLFFEVVVKPFYLKYSEDCDLKHFVLFTSQRAELLPCRLIVSQHLFLVNFIQYSTE
ncbi:hypothetical protein AMR74_15345 [Halorubrum tropicale]|uniref:Uncharacterized protein n=1 Tax=Halorubrum tropicale TaxID=1765655 RepID=A0A0M9APY7_9EURY|nr:hypothetical protein AMR74_15345 [Halorubrum tropicale]